MTTASANRNSNIPHQTAPPLPVKLFPDAVAAANMKAASANRPSASAPERSATFPATATVSKKAANLRSAWERVRNVPNAVLQTPAFARLRGVNLRFLITVPPVNTARRNVLQTLVSVPKKAAIKSAKIHLPAAPRQTAILPQKPVPIVPVLTASKPVGLATQDITLPEVLALQIIRTAIPARPVIRLPAAPLLRLRKEQPPKSALAGKLPELVINAGPKPARNKAKKTATGLVSLPQNAAEVVQAVIHAATEPASIMTAMRLRSLSRQTAIAPTKTAAVSVPHGLATRDMKSQEVLVTNPAAVVRRLKNVPQPAAITDTPAANGPVTQHLVSVNRSMNKWALLAAAITAVPVTLTPGIDAVCNVTALHLKKPSSKRKP